MPVIASAHSGVFAHAIRLAEQIRAIRCARRRTLRQMRLIEAQHMTIAIRLIVQSLGTITCHRDQRRGIGRRPDEDCSSANCRLVIVRRGSTQTILVPFCFAAFRYGIVPVPNVPSPGSSPTSRSTWN